MARHVALVEIIPGGIVGLLLCLRLRLVLVWMLLLLLLGAQCTLHGDRRGRVAIALAVGCDAVWHRNWTLRLHRRRRIELLRRLHSA